MLRTSAIKLDARSRFLYLEVPPEVSQILNTVGHAAAAATGGVADESDHVTLCYVPKADNPLDQKEVFSVLRVLLDAVRGFQPFDVWVGGVAYFDTAMGPDDQPATALVALIDGPGLVDLYTVVRDALRNFGWEWSSNHTFTAHVTLAYLPKGARFDDLPELDAAWTLNEICFANQEIHRISIATSEHIPDDYQGPIEVVSRMRLPYDEKFLGRFSHLYTLEHRKLAELEGNGLLSFRTVPDTGHGQLYSYCSDCAYHVKAPAGSGASFGCSKGDDGSVRDFSDRLTKGETSDAVEKCPLYTPVDHESEGDPVVQARRKIALDEGEEKFFIWHAGMNPCKVCGPFNGVVFSMTDPLPQGMPGAVHAGCHCTAEPVGWATAMLLRDAAAAEAGMVKEVPGEVVHEDDFDPWKDEKTSD